MKAIIDTCVILDYLQGREPFFDDALNLAIGSANREFEAYISANSITDLYYIIHKHTHDDKETRKYLTNITQVFGIADTLAEDCIYALHSDMTDYEDAVMSETASRTGVDYIVTRNARDYTKSKIPVVTPGDFLEMMDSN
jgi:predicted nucleic acid-binding protein